MYPKTRTLIAIGVFVLGFGQVGLAQISTPAQKGRVRPRELLEQKVTGMPMNSTRAFG
jgi:hypothetical protein